MDPFMLLRFFGTGAIKRSLAHYLRKLSPNAWKALATSLQEAIDGAAKADADACAQGFADAISNIR